ncbi:MAG TPA: peptide chain release factor-like protein [Planctomycetota bacterium]|jgi:protein subunit release factor B
MNPDTLVVNLAGDLGVAPSKVKEVKARIERLGIDLAAVEERFIRGGGKGGQKINKTANCVQLRYRGLVVRCQRDRKRPVNRFLALRELVDRIEMKASPATSARLAKAEKAKASKGRVARRARARHRAIAGAGEEE